MLQRIISGGQEGVDIWALRAAKRAGISTGGEAPYGWRTKKGPNPLLGEMYGLTMNHSPNYPPRTEENVKNSDATIRIAFNFESPGERCTLKAIKKYNKPYWDVTPHKTSPADTARWLTRHDVKILNVAGNATDEAGRYAHDFLLKVFKHLERI